MVLHGAMLLSYFTFSILPRGHPLGGRRIYVAFWVDTQGHLAFVKSYLIICRTIVLQQDALRKESRAELARQAGRTLEFWAE